MDDIKNNQSYFSLWANDNNNYLNDLQVRFKIVSFQIVLFYYLFIANAHEIRTTQFLNAVILQNVLSCTGKSKTVGTIRKVFNVLKILYFKFKRKK